MVENLLKTPLYDLHLAFGARLVDFAGWSMPVVYTSIIEEHQQTRTACGVFDVSHMGRLELSGPDAEALLEHLCTRKLAGAEEGRSYYSHICREDGGILDDVIVSRYEEHWLIVCNASNREKIVGWIRRHGAGHNVHFQDVTMQTAMVAIQGPKAMEIAASLASFDLSGLKRYRFTTTEFLGAIFSIFRSGYTGEDGVEVIGPAGLIKQFAPMLLGKPGQPRAGIRLAGLGARDTLRIEAAMPLYGHELTEDWDSLTAGQAWCVDLSKDFIGAAAMRRLKGEGLKRQTVGLELEGRRIARQHGKVFIGGTQVGEVTSGTMSPTLGKSIAMALIETAALDRREAAFEVEVGSARAAATRVELPFYKRPK